MTNMNTSPIPDSPLKKIIENAITDTNKRLSFTQDNPDPEWPVSFRYVESQTHDRVDITVVAELKSGAIRQTLRVMQVITGPDIVLFFERARVEVINMLVAYGLNGMRESNKKHENRLVV